ncbi:MAG: hypothetical protein WC365_10265 [Candidatus Babeliales bacterium]
MINQIKNDGQLKQEIARKKTELLNSLFPNGDSAWKDEVDEDFNEIINISNVVIDEAKTEWNQIENASDYDDILNYSKWHNGEGYGFLTKEEAKNAWFKKWFGENP